VNLNAPHKKVSQQQTTDQLNAANAARVESAQKEYYQGGTQETTVTEHRAGVLSVSVNYSISSTGRRLGVPLSALLLPLPLVPYLHNPGLTVLTYSLVILTP
jgi:hypothetical protein